MHITNHFVDLAPVVQAAADTYHFGTTRICTPDDERERLTNHTDYMLLTRNQAFLDANPPVLREGLSPTIHPVAWTDQYSNLFELLKFARAARKRCIPRAASSRARAQLAAGAGQPPICLAKGIAKLGQTPTRFVSSQRVSKQ